MKAPLCVLFLSAGLLFSCGTSSSDEKTSADPVATPTPVTVETGDPLNTTGLRFDGPYRLLLGGTVYFMRFYPEGNVVMVGGPQSGSVGLAGMLEQNVASRVEEGLHNVPVSYRNDSLFFVTHPVKGDITYAGVVLSPDTVRLLKHSLINGKKGVFDYVFQADPAAGS